MVFSKDLYTTKKAKEKSSAFVIYNIFTYYFPLKASAPPTISKISPVIAA